MSLVVRLYLLLALALVPALLIQVHNELALRRAREADLQAEALRLAQFVAHEMDRVIDGTRTFLLTLSHAPVIRRLDGLVCGEILRDLHQGLPEYASIAVRGRDGRPICGSPASSLPAMVTLAATPLAGASAGRGKALVGTYARGVDGSAGVLGIELPLLDLKGMPAGSINAALDLGRLNDYFAARPMPPGASFGIADRAGTLIVRVPDHELVGQPMRSENRWMLEATAAGTLRGVGPGGVERVVGYVPPALDRHGAMLVSVGLATSGALNAVDDAARRSLLVMLASLLLSAAVVWMGGRELILRPAARLAAVADRWRRGDLAARAGLPTTTGSEFGRLGAALDAMAEGLERHEREMRHAVEALRASEERFRELAANSQDVIWILDPHKCQLEFVSDAFDALWGLPREIVMQDLGRWRDRVHPDDRPTVLEALRRTIEGERIGVDYRVCHPDGSVRYVRDVGFPIRDAAGAVVRVAGICRDVTRWRQSERAQAQALEERMLLLREINHRVKNNLQVIVSLMRLQANRTQREDLRVEFEEACGRIATITEIHSSLFDGEEIGRLNFAAYLRRLCARLEAGSLAPERTSVEIAVEAEPTMIDLDDAVPLALISNELVTNAVKHGTPEEGIGIIQVRLTRHGPTLRLTVEDNGPGIADGKLAGGLGAQIINGFVKRIRGTLTVAGGPGCRIIVEFRTAASDAPTATRPARRAGGQGFD